MPRSSRDRFQSVRGVEPASHNHHRDQRSTADLRNSEPGSWTPDHEGQSSGHEPQVPKFQDLRAKLSNKSAPSKSSFQDPRDRDYRDHQPAGGRNRSPVRASPVRKPSPRGRRSRSPLPGRGRTSDARRDSRPSDRGRVSPRKRTRSRSPTQRSNRTRSPPPTASRRSPRRSPQRIHPPSPGRPSLRPTLASPRMLTPLMNPARPEPIEYRQPPRSPHPYRRSRSGSPREGPEQSYLMPLILPVSGESTISFVVMAKTIPLK